MVGCCYVLPQPSGTVENAFRIHRLVVLPDYQGLGIGSKLLNYVCNIYKYNKKEIYLRTSNYKLIEYMKNSNKWKGDGKLSHSKQHSCGQKNVNEKRLSTSFKYIGEINNNYENDYKKVQFVEHIEEKNQYTQLNLFDFI